MLSEAKTARPLIGPMRSWIVPGGREAPPDQDAPQEVRDRACRPTGPQDALAHNQVPGRLPAEAVGEWLNDADVFVAGPASSFRVKLEQLAA